MCGVDDMALADFLAFLLATTYTSGGLAAEGRKVRRGAAQLPSDRENELTKAFHEHFMPTISLALGRPYRWEYPEYLKKQREYWMHDKKRDAETDWLIRSQNGVMEYIARKEGWQHRLYFCTTASRDELVEEQEEYMSWFEEARGLFPHYAMDHIYVEDYPTKEDYFAGIQKYREEYSDLEEPFGFPSESDDPGYDTEIRRLFYTIDPAGKLGGVEMKYVVFRYVKPYEYHGDDWENTQKLYTALNRIVREEGLDPNECLKKDGLFSYFVRDDVVDGYKSGHIGAKKIEELKRIIEERKPAGKKIKPEDQLEYEIHMEALRLLLRIDGYDPTMFGL